MLQTKTYSNKIFNQTIKYYRIDPTTQMQMPESLNTLDNKFIIEMKIESNIFNPILERSLTIVDSTKQFVPTLKTDGCSIISISMREVGILNKLIPSLNLMKDSSFNHDFIVSGIEIKEYDTGTYVVKLISIHSIYLLSKITFSSRGEKSWVKILNTLLGGQSKLNFKINPIVNNKDTAEHFISHCNQNFLDAVYYCLGKIFDDGLGLGFLRYTLYNNKYDLIFLTSYIDSTADERQINNFKIRNNRKDTDYTNYILQLYETNALGYEKTCDALTPLTMLTYDYEKRKYKGNSFDEYRLSSLGFETINGEESFANFNMFKTGNNGIYTNKKTIYKNRYPLYDTLKAALLLSNILVVTTYGNLLRNAGQVMTVSGDYFINNMNRRYEGAYLITSVTHVFTTQDYYSYIQCARMTQAPAQYGKGIRAVLGKGLQTVKKFIDKWS